MSQANPVEEAVSNLEDNPIVDVAFEAAHGCLSDEPRTIRGTFPGSKTRAMGHALYVVELFEDDGIEAEHEYVEPVEGRESHVIDVIVEGGGSPLS